jgi:hypothetical protein
MSTLEVDDLRRKGIHVPAEPVLSAQQMREFRAVLDAAPMYHHHIAGKATESPEPGLSAAVARGWNVFAPKMADVLRAPHWFECALSWRDVAKEYFEGREPLMYSVSAFWTTPGEGPLYGDTQTWHRDQDDQFQTTLFMLGSDVPDPSEGAHIYQRGTHKIPDAGLGRDPPSPPPCGLVEVVYGPAGTLVVADTWGLHKAIRPARLPRLLVWARYAVADPPFTYVNDGLAPVPRDLLGERYPSDPALQNAVRLVVA